MMPERDPAPPLSPFALVLIILWVLLFGCRWLATPLLINMDPARVEQTARMDQRFLLPIYLVLLIATLALAAMRFAGRGATATIARAGDQSRPAREAETRDPVEEV